MRRDMKAVQVFRVGVVWSFDEVMPICHQRKEGHYSRAESLGVGRRRINPGNLKGMPD